MARAKLINLSTGVTVVKPLSAQNVTVVGNEDQDVIFNARSFQLTSTQSITISSLTSAGSLLYKTAQGQWQSVTQGMEFNFNALQQGRLKFVAANNQFGDNYAQFNYQLKSGNTISSNTGQVSLKINSVNDAPVAINNTLEINKTGLSHLAKSVFTFSDVDNTDIRSVKITSLINPGSLVIKNPITGKLLALKAGSVIGAADLDNVFINASGIKNASQTSFKFQVFDGSAWSDAKQPAVMTLKLIDPAAAITVISGDTSGTLQENVNVVNNEIQANGVLTTNKPTQPNMFVANTITNNYGTFSVESNGSWKYKANNSSTAVQQLAENQQVNMQFTVNTSDNKSQIVTINLRGTNDSPIITGHSEHLEVGSNQSKQVSSLFQATDIDNGAAAPGIAIVAADNTAGAWQYSSDGGNNWINLATVSMNNALLLNGSDYIRFVPTDPAFGGVSNISFLAWDKTSGTAHNYSAINGQGGSSAFSAITATTQFLFIDGNNAFTVSADSWTNSSTLNGGLGDDTVTVTGSSKQLSLGPLFFTQLQNVENLSLSSGHDYSIDLSPNTSVQNINFTNTQAGSNVMLDTSQANNTVTLSNINEGVNISLGSGDDTVAINYATLPANAQIHGGDGTDTVRLTGVSSDLNLTTNDLMRFDSIERLVLEDGHNYNFTLDDNSSLQEIDASQLSAGYSVTVDATARTQNIRVIGGGGDDTVKVNNAAVISDSNLGLGFDSIVWSGGNLNDSDFNNVSGVNQLTTAMPAITVTLSNALVGTSETKSLVFVNQLNNAGLSGVNRISLDATAVSAENKVFLDSQMTYTNIVGSSSQTIYAQNGLATEINYAALQNSNITYVLGSRNDSVLSNASNTTYKFTFENYSQGDDADGYYSNTNMLLTGSATGSLDVLVMNNLNPADPTRILLPKDSYSKLAFLPNADNLSGTHFQITLGAFYSGHSIANGFLDGPFDPNTKLTYNATRLINYDGSALTSHDSLVVDARDYASMLKTTTNVSTVMDIKIIGGAGDDIYYAPNFSQFNYVSGSTFKVSGGSILTNINSSIKLGDGDDTFVLTVDKFPNKTTGFVYDGQSDSAGTGPEGLGHGDTLKIEGANRTVTLSDIGTFLKNIEQVDLGANHDDGSGKYTFTLTLNSVLNLSDSRNDLVIHGGSDDTVKLADPSNWTQKTDVEISGKSYHVYANPANEDQKIYIQSDIVITS